jgi:proteasome beta subunit
MNNYQNVKENVIKTGTTGLAVRFRDGVVIAADKRVSAGYVVNKKFDKISMLDKSIGMAISGSVSDAQSLIDLLKAELQLYKFDNGVNPTVKTAASLAATIFHSGYRSLQFYMVYPIIGGVDEQGSHIYGLDASGSLTTDDYMATGSGQLFSISILEDGWKEDMTKDEAITLAKRALRMSTSRDLYSGDGMDFYIITKEGLEKKQVKLVDQEA